LFFSAAEAKKAEEEEQQSDYSDDDDQNAVSENESESADETPQEEPKDAERLDQSEASAPPVQRTPWQVLTCAELCDSILEHVPNRTGLPFAQNHS
jgi:hypothetical protein